MTGRRVARWAAGRQDGGWLVGWLGGVAGRAGPLDGRLASLARVDLIYVRTHLDPPPILDRPPVFIQKSLD